MDIFSWSALVLGSMAISITDRGRSSFPEPRDVPDQQQRIAGRGCP